MIEGDWNRPSHGIHDYTRPDATPPWAPGKEATGQLGERPISVYTALSELRFASDDDGIAAGPKKQEPYPSPCSPISQIRFAPPEETMTLLTPIEIDPLPRDSFLSLSTTDSSSLGTHEGSDQTRPSEDSSRRRPLPGVPGHTQSRPLPPRPARMATVPADPFARHPFREFVQGCSKDSSIASRPFSDSVFDSGSRLVEENQLAYDSTPEDTPAPRVATSPSLVSPVSPPPPPSPPPPSLTLPVAVPTFSKPSYLADLVSPSSIDLVTAAGLPIVGELGEEISFGALFRDRKAIVIFIRYFWCLHCEDYVRLVLKSLTPEILRSRGVDLFLISNGPPDMIKLYKSMDSSTLESCIFDETDFAGFRDAEIPVQGVYGSVVTVA